MSDKLSHKGIFYSITNVGVRLWKWQVLPPNSVNGLYEEVGETAGERADAIVAARLAIERQTSNLF